MAVNNLPVQTTPFIGRDDELAEIAALLADPDCRLLTLTGPGGIGKTRLAVQAAAQVAASFADGVYFVALNPLSSPDYLIPTLAGTVGFSFSGQEDPLQQLLNYLSSKHMLLVIDNFEHLIEAAGLIPAILQAAPGIKVLVTSRAVLDLQEEWIRPVQGLKFPEEAASQPIETYSAAQLFIERARRVQANFSPRQEQECIARICRLVQGMPLALELAATWLKTLTCAEIAAEIQRSMNILATTLRNVPERHRSMRAVFEQSWNLLGSSEREAFKRMAVFQGRFHHQAAQAVTGADLLTLQALVDQSLLRMAPDGRYEIHELLKQYAAERLSENPHEEEQACEQHANYYAGYLSRQEKRLIGPDQLAVLDQIDAEIDNIRSAWRWAVEKGNAETIRQFMGCLLIYNQIRTRIHEGADMFNLALQRFEGSGGQLEGNLCMHAAWFEATRGKYGRAVHLFEKGFSLLTDGCPQGSSAMALAGTTFIYDSQGLPWDIAKVMEMIRAYFENCRRTGERWGEAWLAYALGAFAFYDDRSDEALVWLRGSLDIFRDLEDRWSSTNVLNLLGVLLIKARLYSEAQRVFQESLAICQELRDLGGVAFCLGHLGEIAAHLKEYESSRQYILEAVKIMYETKQNLFMFWNLFDLAESLHRTGENERAVQICAFILSQRSDPETESYIRPRLEAYQREMQPEAYARAVQAGESTDLDTLIQDLWAEFSQQKETATQTLTPQARPTSGSSPLVEELSPRELEVLSYVAAGYSNQEIARKLTVTVGTVKKHINNIFGKLQVSNRTQAAARARELGIL